jgi:pimeloyl-ACP methyl ester carboxylesterase
MFPKSSRKNIISRLPIRIIQFFIGLFLIGLVLFFMAHFYLKSKTRLETKITTAKGIDSLFAIQLDGIEQWINIRGEDRDNPVILFLHGGPGAPLFPGIQDIGVKTGLEKSYVMVYWEQPGTGKSSDPDIPDSIMTINKLVSYTGEIGQYLKDKFTGDNLFLLARSWGSVIGLLSVKKYPEMFTAYLSIGQLVVPLKNDQLSYQFTLELAKKYDRQAAIEELRTLGSPPFSPDRIIIQRRWLTEFYRKFMEEKFNVHKQNQLIKLLSTPEYSIIDIVKMGQDPFFSIRHLWNDNFYNIDFFKQVSTLPIPVVFITGKYDYFTPPQLTRKYYHKVQAPAGKELIIFQKSGHHPELEQPQKFKRIINNKLDSLSRLNR